MSKILVLGKQDSEASKIQKKLESWGHSVRVIDSARELESSLEDFDSTTLHFPETILEQGPDKKYRLLFENAADSITFRNQNGQIVEANPKACSMLGYDLTEIAGKDFKDLISPDCHAILPDILEKLKKEGVVDYEIKFLKKDGSKFLAEARCKEIHDGDQDLVMCISRDLTQRKQMERDLNKVEENYRLIVETAEEGILASDQNQKINYVNQKMANMLGYKRQEMMGRRMTEFIFKDDLPDHRKRIENRKKNISERFERRIRHKDGTERWMVISATPLRKRQSFAGSFAMFTDITDTKRAEDELKDSETKYRSVIENAAEGIIILDKNGTVTEMNNRLTEISGIKRKDIVGEKFFEYLPDVGINCDDALTEFNNFMAGKKVNKPYWTIRSGGKESAFIAHSSLLKKNGEINGTSIILEDVTDRLKAENEMKNSLKEKEFLLKEKEVLLREIHHRVKNNLQIISSLLNLQSKYVVNEQDQEFFIDTQSRIKSMAIIHEQLYQAKDFGNINIESYLRHLAQGLLTSYNINPHSIRLVLDVPDLKFDINAAIPLGLLINEILTNSLKHAFPCVQDGQVSLTELMNGTRKNELSFADHCQIHLQLTSKNGKFNLIISDNGIGLPRDLDFKNTSTLGFQLINSLVKQLNGTIELERNHGTRFKIQF